MVIRTGREQLNVQKKKKVNDDQNEKKKVYFDGSAENCVVSCCVYFSTREGIGKLVFLNVWIYFI